MSIFCVIRSDDVDLLENYVLEIGTTDCTPTISETDSELDRILSANPPLICIAAFFGATKCFDFLQMSGADLDLTDSNGVSLVHFASCGGSLDICDSLDSTGADFNCHDTAGMSCLHYACKYGRSALVERFITRNFDIHEPGPMNYLPIHFACFSNSFEVCEILIENGCDINATVGEKVTPFTIALKNSVPALRCLLKHHAKSDNIIRHNRTAFLEACYTGEIEIVTVFLEAGIDVNQGDAKLGWTPLIYAASRGHLEVIQMLVDHEANVNKTSCNGLSPALAARNNDHPEAEKLLVSRGAVYHVKD